METLQPLVLASKSEARRRMLEAAGLEFDVVRASIDERAAEAPLLEADLPVDDIAAVLAEAKALDVSARRPGALVLGCDQILDLDGERLTKPADMDAARRQLLALSGREHALHSAAALARDKETVWRHTATARLQMRKLSPAFVGRYLAAVGERALDSVGAYEIEGPGVQLFEAVEGDLFTVQGLPLLPLLSELRQLRAIAG